MLATGLKYYPAFAAAGFLWTHPTRRMPVLAGVAVVAAGLTLWSVAPQMERARFRIDSGVHTMGAPLLGRDLGWSDQASQGLALGLVALGAVGLARGRFTTGLASAGALHERLLAVLGAILLLACFAAGVNYAYRWIFIFWMALWLWRQAAWGAPADRAARTARLACGLAALAMWGDGFLCVFFNRIVPLLPAQFASIDGPWRLLTQPLHWLLMALLAGWLLEGALATIQSWRDAARDEEKGAALRS